MLYLDLRSSHELIGSLEIRNMTGAGDAEFANYEATLISPGGVRLDQRIVAEIDRRRGAWYVVSECLAELQGGNDDQRGAVQPG